MKRLPDLLVLLVLAVPASGVASAHAGPPPNMTLVVVGSDGRSVTIEPEPAVLAVLFYAPHSVYDVQPRPASPRGGYVRIYPLGSEGFPAIPGRFYPVSGALCFDWNQARTPRSCGRLGRPQRLVGASRRVALFHGLATTLAVLYPGGTENLFAALELAFDRYETARPAPRPAGCLAFHATWYGPRAAQRPRQICVSHRGVYARGHLYPAGLSIWRLARDSH